MNNNSTFRTHCVRPPLLFAEFDTARTGIDKLNITTSEFIVSDASRLNIDYYGRKAGSSEATQERLFTDSNGDSVAGRKAYFNGDSYGLNISSYGLQVVMSPAKVLQPERPFLLPCDASEIDEAARIVAQRIQQDTGVLFSYDAAKVCRLDLAKQNEMQRAIREYVAAFTMLRLKGSRGATKQFGQQTFQYNSSNSQHQLIFYDKAAEYLSGQPAGKLPADLRAMAHGSSYLRAELRLLKTDYIRKATGTHGTFAELLNAGSDKWNSIYNDYLRTKVFTGEYQTTLQFDEGNLRNLFEALASEGNALNGRKQASRRNLVSRAAAAVGVRCIVDEIGISTFLAVASEFGTSDRHIRRTRQYIEQNARIASQLWKGVETLDLINELRQAFAA